MSNVYLVNYLAQKQALVLEHNTPDVLHWSVEEMGRWLESIGVHPQYVTALAAIGLCGSNVLQLTKAHFYSVGIMDSEPLINQIKTLICSNQSQRKNYRGVRRTPPTVPSCYSEASTEEGSAVEQEPHLSHFTRQRESRGYASESTDGMEPPRLERGESFVAFEPEGSDICKWHGGMDPWACNADPPPAEVQDFLSQGHGQSSFNPSPSPTLGGSYDPFATAFAMARRPIQTPPPRVQETYTHHNNNAEYTHHNNNAEWMPAYQSDRVSSREQTHLAFENHAGDLSESNYVAQESTSELHGCFRDWTDRRMQTQHSNQSERRPLGTRSTQLPTETTTMRCGFSNMSNESGQVFTTPAIVDDASPYPQMTPVRSEVSSAAPQNPVPRAIPAVHQIAPQHAIERIPAPIMSHPVPPQHVVQRIPAPIVPAVQRIPAPGVVPGGGVTQKAPQRFRDRNPVRRNVVAGGPKRTPPRVPTRFNKKRVVKRAPVQRVRTSAPPTFVLNNDKDFPVLGKAKRSKDVAKKRKTPKAKTTKSAAPTRTPSPATAVTSNKSDSLENLAMPGTLKRASKIEINADPWE